MTLVDRVTRRATLARMAHRRAYTAWKKGEEPTRADHPLVVAVQEAWRELEIARNVVDSVTRCPPLELRAS